MPIIKNLLDILSERETQKILIKLAIKREITVSELRDYGIKFETILFTLDYLLDQGILTKKSNATFIVAKNQKAECLVKAYREMIIEDISRQFFEIENFLKSQNLKKEEFEAFLEDFENILKIYKPLIDNEFPEQLKRIVSRIRKINEKFTK